jgi:hypothetical protein
VTQYLVILLCLSILSYCCVSVSYHVVVSQYLIMLLCLCILSCCCVSVPYHAVVSQYRIMLLCLSILSCCCVSVPYANSHVMCISNKNSTLVPLRLSCVGTEQPANYLNLIICLRIYIQTTVDNFLLFIEPEACLPRLQQFAT